MEGGRKENRGVYPVFSLFLPDPLPSCVSYSNPNLLDFQKEWTSSKYLKTKLILQLHYLAQDKSFSRTISEPPQRINAKTQEASFLFKKNFKSNYTRNNLTLSPIALKIIFSTLQKWLNITIMYSFNEALRFFTRLGARLPPSLLPFLNVEGPNASK